MQEKVFAGRVQNRKPMPGCGIKVTEIAVGENRCVDVAGKPALLAQFVKAYEQRVAGKCRGGGIG